MLLEIESRGFTLLKTEPSLLLLLRNLCRAPRSRGRGQEVRRRISRENELNFQNKRPQAPGTWLQSWNKTASVMTPKTHTWCVLGVNLPNLQTEAKQDVCLFTGRFHLPFQSHSFVTKTNSSGWEQLRKKNTFLHVQACWSGNTCKGLDCDQFQVKPCSLMYVCVHFNPSETPRLWETDGSERKSPPPSKRQSRTQVNKCWRRRQALAEARP